MLLTRKVIRSSTLKDFDVATYQGDGNVMSQSLGSWITNLQFVEPCDQPTNGLGDEVQGFVGFV
jgi:hypothetical protein